ncbi:MAG: light-harvesting antenna LH1, alpha subunit [Halochromatium sp.]
MNEKLYKIWLLVSPVNTLIALSVFLTFLGLAIHMIVLSTELNWLDDGIPPIEGAKSAQVAPQQDAIRFIG